MWSKRISTAFRLSARLALLLAGVATTAGASDAAPPQWVPGTRWHHNDLARPQPEEVTPGITDCSGSPPPSDAVVLFDGHDLAQWTGENLDQWAVRDGVMIAVGKRGGHLLSKETFGDAQVHVEFRTPPDTMSQAQPQFRGNSGVFLMDLYEIQVLGSYRSPTYADGLAGALYGQWPPLVNASLPAGHWQCYDIVFRAPRFAAGKLTQRGEVTVLHNGVAVQVATPILSPTSEPDFQHYAAHAAALPLGLQNHGDGVSFVPYRNVWVRRLTLERP